MITKRVPEILLRSQHLAFVLELHFLQPRVSQFKRDIYRWVFFSFLHCVWARRGKTKTTLLFCLLMGKQKRYDKKVKHHLFFDHKQEGERLCLFVSPLRMGTPKENRAIDVSIELADPTLQKVNFERERNRDSWVRVEFTSRLET